MDIQIMMRLMEADNVPFDEMRYNMISQYPKFMKGIVLKIMDKKFQKEFFKLYDELIN